MTTHKQTAHLIEQLNIPKQDLASLSFCNGTRASGINDWLRSLPVAEIQLTSNLLHKALQEIGRYQTPASNRIRLLESLRSTTLQTLNVLAQGFLNQPLILPYAAVKTASAVQTTQKLMIQAYLVAVRDLLQEPSPNLKLLALAIHRATASLSLLLLRYYQLYVPIPNQIWVDLHCLYQLGEHFSVNGLVVDEEIPHSKLCNTVSLSYLRTLLLHCARPNQLRQNEIQATFDLLDQLAAFASLHPAALDRHDNLFAVLLNSNRPPLYRSRFSSEEKSGLLELNTTLLCEKLAELSDCSAHASKDTQPKINLTPALASHLLKAWNLLAQRHFERTNIDGILEVTIGLTNIHYHFAGSMLFSDFIKTEATIYAIDASASLFQPHSLHLLDTTSKDNYWGERINPQGDKTKKQLPATGNIDYVVYKPASTDGANAEKQAAGDMTDDHHPVFSVPLVNSSSGGYCIEWRVKIPSQVKAGELLGLRDPIRDRWNLGVVRWATQVKGATQLGIQILAPQATPVGIALINKTGTPAEFLRALEVPALKAINQPVSLITNAVSFREYTKARLYRRTESEETSGKSAIQLTRRLFSTGGFSQFTYRTLTINTTNETDKTDDFDSVWDKY